MRNLNLFFAGLLCLFSACQRTKSAAGVNHDPYYQKAVAFTGTQPDSAFYYFNKVVSTSRDSLQVARSLNQMAQIQSEAGDLFGAQETLLQSLKFLDTANARHYRCLSSDYNELGLTSAGLRHYEVALGYYDQAARFAQNKDYQLIYLNNKALAYEKKGGYDQALKIYQIVLVKNAANPVEYARTLSNLARTKWLRDPGYPAGPELAKALLIRRQQHDLWGQNASYAHLADYYTSSYPDSALAYAKDMYVMASRIHSPDDRLQALDKLIRLSPPVAAKAYFSSYRRLNDSLQNARNAAKNQFALIRYNTEKNKADNLRLQKDNTEKQYELIKQSIVLYSVVLLFLVLAAVAALWYSKRRRRQQEETREAIRDTQRKAVKKVHDTLANDIYRLMKKVQHGPEPDKDRLLDEIEDLYNRARDLSYEMAPVPDEHFEQQIAELLSSFASSTTKVLITGNSAELWQRVAPGVRLELRYILQELMVNMQKHSGAGNTVIKFEQAGDRCRISYFDDGKGMPQGPVRKNGLTNTGNRIKSIRGTINFDSSTAKGLQIQISFPIA